jgi:hypothetical protein
MVEFLPYWFIGSLVLLILFEQDRIVCKEPRFTFCEYLIILPLAILWPFGLVAYLAYRNANRNKDML